MPIAFYSPTFLAKGPANNGNMILGKENITKILLY